MVEEIQFSNMPELDAIKLQRVQDIAQKHYGKIKRISGEKTSLKVNFKETRHSSAKSLYTINVVMLLRNKKIAAEKSDWNIIAAMQTVMSNLEREVFRALKK